MHHRFIPALDGLRAVAVLMVLFSHGYPSLEVIGLPTFKAREQVGLFGVEIFFAISGYLITTLLLAEESRSGSANLAAFYKRRAFRILPAALVLISCIAFLSNYQIIPRVETSRIVSTILFMANYSTAESSYYLAYFWSLAVEEHFYFVWPAIFVFAARSQRVYIAAALAIAIAVWRAIDWRYQITGDGPAKFFGRTDIAADAIIWGVVVALLAAHSQGGPKLIRALSIKPLWCALIFISIVSSIVHFGNFKLHFFMFICSRVSTALAVYGAVINYQSLLGQLLDSPPARFIGASLTVCICGNSFFSSSQCSFWLFRHSINCRNSR
jgi:peptidoglycan/LPS O-acetylase OafA/YrhL